MELRDLAAGYLEAEGYEVSVRARDLLVGHRRSVAEDTEFIYLWVLSADDPKSRAAREGPLLPRFKDATDSHPSAPKYLLVDSREGLSKQFQEGAQRWYNVKIRVPAQLFDTSFKWEESAEAASASLDLRRRGDTTRSRRAHQPFSAAAGEAGPDLLPKLVDKLRGGAVGDRPIQLVVGPAGMGKTILFESLYAELFDRFLKDKQRQVLSPRPLPLLPQHVAQADASTIKSILSGFLQTEFARPLDKAVFEWRLMHGMATWLLDGLDEIIAQDREFFDYLLEILTNPKAEAPRILICVRDSLLATNEAVREFLDDYGDVIDLYRLEAWGTESKRQFATLSLGDSADHYLGALDARAELDALASTPYYCALLAEQYVAGAMREGYSELELLDAAVDRIIGREIEKGLVREDISPKGEIIEFAEAIAAEDMEGGFQGVAVEDVRELASIVLSEDLEPEALDRFLAQMLQLAFFASGTLGRVQFAQEILEQYLLGLWLARLVDNPDTSILVRGLGLRHIPADWLTLRVLAERLRIQQRSQWVRELAMQVVGRGTVFKNLVQAAALAAEAPGALKSLPLDRQDLAGVVFEDLDLAGVSFRSADLTDTVFRRCDLRGAKFDDAILSNTAFSELADDALAGAEVGTLSRFFSMRVDRAGIVRTPALAGSWFEERTRVSGPVVDPCEAALQLRHLFHKFVRPDGTARRSWLDRKALDRGTRFADPALTSDAAVQYGYLVPDQARERVERPTGEAYSEMIAFAKDLTLSPGLRSLLDDTCNREGCPHVPEPA